MEDGRRDAPFGEQLGRLQRADRLRAGADQADVAAVAQQLGRGRAGSV